MQQTVSPGTASWPGHRGLGLGNSVATARSRLRLWAAGGLAPIWSPHVSFMGLSEAIFQNWLHLRGALRSPLSGVVNERGGPRDASAGAQGGRPPGGTGCPAAASCPEGGPPGVQAVT